MSRSEYSQFTNEMKSKVADIIVQFNFLELSIKEILAIYIQSTKKDFVSDILLNNSIVSFGSKISLLLFITNKEKIKFFIKEDLYSLINIRNAIAHSDNLFNMEGKLMGYETIDEEFGIEIPIYDPSPDGPIIIQFKSGKIYEEGFDKRYKEFNEKMVNAQTGLDAIKEILAKSIS